jgi:ABC-2 type transport system permease protein
MKARELIRSAFVIGRRDFTATVMSKAFLLFLLGPLFPVLMGVAFGGIGARIDHGAERPVVAVVASPSDFARLSASHARLAAVMPDSPLVVLSRQDPRADAARQRVQLLHQEKPPVLGVLEGGLAAPHFTGAVSGDGRTIRQLMWMIDDARVTDDARDRPARRPLAVTITERSTGSVSAARAVTAYGGQALLFILTILLAGMLLSQLIEEKSNKVIEILAAAVPVDAIFLGKLFAMLAMSLIGIAVWSVAGAAAIAIWSGKGLSGLPGPAVGWPMFLALVPLYFAMSYLLIGSVFLGIGSQASTVREVQTLSMPVTMAQVMLFGFASIGVGDPNGAQAIAAAIFPLSSPFAMLGRAAEDPALWPHLAAILWQALWVALILRVAAGLFRRSVLKSGQPIRWFWQRRTS